MESDTSQFRFQYKFQQVSDKTLIVHFLKYSKYLFRETQIKKIIAKTQLTAHYNFEHKSSSIKCDKIRLQQDKTEQAHKNLQQILSEKLDSIWIYKLNNTNLHIDDKFTNLHKAIQLEQYIAMSLIRQKQGNAKIGDLLIYTYKHKQQESLRLIRMIQNFQNQQLEYQLIQWMNDRNIKNYLRKKIARQIAKVLYNPLVHIAEKRHIAVLDISSKFNNQDRISINFEVQGLSNQFIPFYRDIQELINKVAIQIIELKEVLCNTKDITNSKNKKTFEFIVEDCLVLGKIIEEQQDQVQFNKLVNKALTTQWLIKQQFQIEQFQLIQSEKQQLKRFVIEKEIQYQNLIITRNYIMIKCNRYNKILFVEYVKEFLQEKKKITSICHNFKARHISEYLIKYFAEEINRKYSCQFFIQNQQLKRYNFEVDNDNLQELIQQCRLKIIKKLVKVYTLRQIFKHPLYKIEINPQQTKYQNLSCVRYKIGNKTFVNISSINSVSKFIQNVIILFKQENLQNMFLDNIFRQNNISISMVKSILGSQTSNLLQQSTYNSRHFHKIILWAIPTLITKNSNKNIRYNVRDIIDSMIPQQKINIFLIGKQFKQFENAILEFLFQMFEQKKNQDQCETINFYCQSPTIRQGLQRSLRMSRLLNAQLRNSLYITPKTIDKIINLKYFALSYYQNQRTKVASSLNSFIFHHQMKINENYNINIKVPIILPKQSNLLTKQYLIDYSNNCYYIINQNSEILKRKSLKQMPNLKLKNLIEIIKQKFKKIQYLVSLGSENPKNSILDNINLYYIQSKSPGLLNSMYLDSNNKIKVSSDTPPLPYQFQKSNNVKYFAIETIQQQLNTVKQFISRAQ